MEDDFLANYLIIYIKREIAKDFSTDTISDEFYSWKECQVQLA